MSWKKISLLEITKGLYSGGRPKGGAVTEGIPSLGAEHLNDQGSFNFKSLKYVPQMYYQCMPRGKIQQNDILIVKDGATTGKVSFVNGNFPFNDAAINEHLFQLKVDESLCYPKYCFYYLFSEQGQKQILNDFRGATVGGISRKFLEYVKFKLPPIAIQKKIVAILDQADILRQKDLLLLEKYDELLGSLFYQMFGDPVKNEKNWEVKAVIENCDCIVPGRDKPKSFSGDIPWITTDDLNHLGYTKISKRQIGLTAKEIEHVRARLIPKGSVVMTCVGDLGIVSIADSDMVVNQQLHSFQIKKKFNNVFLMFALSYQEKYMLRMATSTTVPYMNKSVCNSIPVIIPPMELQNKFSECYHCIDMQKSIAKEQLKCSEQLFQSLLQKAFKGELVN